MSSSSSPKAYKSLSFSLDGLDKQQRSAMPPNNRSAGRDIHIYDGNDGNDTETALGGMILTAGVTNSNFYAMVEVLFVFSSPFFMRVEDGTKITKDDQPLLPGKYFVVSEAPFHVNNEPWFVRAFSRATGTRTAAFCEAVCSRDRQCPISGTHVPTHGGHMFLDGFEASHIFPLAYEGHWIDHNYDRWITIQPAKGGSINSLQNGLLLRSDMHQFFDAYAITINPDDNYKVVAFWPIWEGIAGKYLDQSLFSRPDAPVDMLLRWHFRQAVLANMRGAGEPVFEHDLPPGSDIVGSILLGPEPAERMEFELFTRLGVQMELFSK